MRAAALVLALALILALGFCTAGASGTSADDFRVVCAGAGNSSTPLPVCDGDTKHTHALTADCDRPTLSAGSAALQATYQTADATATVALAPHVSRVLNISAGADFSVQLDPEWVCDGCPEPDRTPAREGDASALHCVPCVRGITWSQLPTDAPKHVRTFLAWYRKTLTDGVDEAVYEGTLPVFDNCTVALLEPDAEFGPACPNGEYVVARNGTGALVPRTPAECAARRRCAAGSGVAQFRRPGASELSECTACELEASGREARAHPRFRLDVAHTCTCTPGAALQLDDGTCRACAPGTYKPAPGTARCLPCSAAQRLCYGEISERCTCESAPPVDLVSPAQSCAQLGLDCPSTFSELDAFFRAHKEHFEGGYEGTMCWLLVSGEKDRGWRQQSQYFNHTLLCSEPRAPDAQPMPEGELYISRSTCTAGERARPPVPWLDTECEACPPDQYQGDAEHRETKCEARLQCTGHKYDRAPLLVEQANCQDESVLVDGGEIPAPNASAPRVAFSDARRAPFSFGVPADSSSCRDLLGAKQAYAEAQPVLMGLWQRGAFKLPPASEESVRGVPLSLDMDSRHEQCLLACNSGYEFDPKSKKCAACAAGNYKPEAAIDAVLDTLDTNGRLQHVPCRKCPPGTYAEVSGSPECRQCPQGKYCPAGTSTPQLCEAPGSNTGTCDPAEAYLTGPCGAGRSAGNCARCPLGRTLRAQTWGGWGARAHCDLACPAQQRLRTDTDNASQWTCVQCEPGSLRACGGVCEAGFRLPAGAGDDGLCVKCEDDAVTFAEVCGGAHVAATLDVGCPAGVGARCVPCAAPPNASLVAVRGPKASSCAYVCDRRVRGGAQYVPFAEAVQLLAFGPDRDVTAAELGGCVRTRVLARETCPAQVARLAGGGAEPPTVECADAADCTGLAFVTAQRARGSAGGVVCACTSGMFGQNVGRGGGRPCEVCPEGMTSLVGTAAVEGCFCRAGWAPVLGGGACVPCGSESVQGAGGKYCPGGFSNYTRDVLPFLLPNAEHATDLPGTRCHDGTAMPADTGACLCAFGLEPSAAAYADNVAACTLAVGKRFGADGTVEACENVSFAHFVNGYAPCSTECVEGAVRSAAGECACDGSSGYAPAGGDAAACACRPGWARPSEDATLTCRRCEPGTFCTGGDAPARTCGQDKTSQACAVGPLECRCRAGYFFSMNPEQVQDGTPASKICEECSTNAYCQPNCNYTDTDAELQVLGMCTCPHYASCKLRSYPEVCEPGESWPSDATDCTLGSHDKLWINDLVCAPQGQCAMHIPEFGADASSVLQNMDLQRYFAHGKSGVFLLSAAGPYCAAEHTLVLAGAGSPGLAGDCLYAGVRLHSAAAVPLVRARASAGNDPAPLLLLHEAVPSELVGRLTAGALHLAWNLVLECAAAPAPAERAWSELSVCHECRTGRVVLEAAAAAGGTLRDGSALGAGGAAYWLPASAYAVLGLPYGEACVGVVIVAGPRALRHEIVCTDAERGLLAHKQATNSEPAASPGAALAYAWLAVLPQHWQLQPARTHGSHTLLVLACRADGTGALLVEDFSNDAWPVHAIELGTCAGHCCAANASRAAPAHVLERTGSTLYVLAPTALLRIELGGFTQQSTMGAVQVVQSALAGGDTAVHAAGWLSRAAAAQPAQPALVVFVRVHGAAGASPGQVLRRYTCADPGSPQEETLLTSAGLDEALALELGARPVRALWSPYNGTRAALGPLAILNSEEAGDRGRGEWPLHVLAHLELHRNGRTMRARAVLEFENATAPVRVRVVRVLQRPELQGAALALAYVAAPLRAHGTHGNVLAVEGRALAVHMHGTTLQLVLDVAAFACFECEAHERWDPAAQRCTCLPGSLAACLPCIEGSACDPHRAVYSPAGAGCVVLNDVEHAVYEERCLPCGVGAPFFCAGGAARACPGGEYAHTASGLAPGVYACRCAPGQTRGADGACVPCEAPAVCAPALTALGLDFACPAGTELDSTRAPDFVCACRPGLLAVDRREWVVERDARWPEVARASGRDEVLLRLPHARVNITVAACGPCPPERYCRQGRAAPCGLFMRPAAGQTHCTCNDGFKPAGAHGACAACPRDEVCVWNGTGIAVHPCAGGDLAHNAEGLAALCPCEDSSGGARVFRPGEGCVLCRAGHYCPPAPPRERHREIPCPPNASAAQGSSSKNNCTCRAGLELRNGSCTSCAPGKYSTGGSARCEQCPALATAPAGAASVHECQCPEDRELRMPEGCVCRDAQSTTDGGCQACPNAREEAPAPGDAGTGTCTHCKPGFWRTTESNLHTYTCMNRSRDADGHPYAHEARAAWRQYEAEYGVLTAGNERCVLCPPGYACEGGASAPTAPDLARHSYQLVPAGLREHALGWRSCPDMRTHRQPRWLSTVGFGSCVLEADTWGAQPQPQHVAALGRFGAVAALAVDTLVHSTRLLNVLLDARTVPANLNPALDYVDRSAKIAWSRESPTRFVFYLEIDVLRLAYAYHDELHGVVADLDAHDDNTAAAAAALLPAIWALHHAHAHGAARLADFFVPVTSLVHNELSASAVHSVLAHVARRMPAAALPQVRFIVAQTQLLAQDPSAYLAERGGLAYVRVLSGTEVMLAQYAGDVPREQAATLSGFRQPPVATIVQDVLQPSLAIPCPTGTTSASEQGARACAACGRDEWYNVGDRACEPCTSYPMFMCSAGPTVFEEPFECSWQRDGACGACLPLPSGCCDPEQRLAQTVAQLLSGSLSDTE